VLTLPVSRQAAGVAVAIRGVDVARLSDWFRYSLFRTGIRVALLLVAVAVGLSFTGPGQSPIAVLAAGGILALPLAVAALRPWEAWRVVFRHPAVMLLVGPLAVVVGVLGDRSAFYYPEVMWMAGAAIVGGMRWALASIVVFTVGSTLAGILTGEDDGYQALGEMARVIGPRVVLTVLLAGLFEGLAQIVWLRVAEVAQGQLGGALPGPGMLEPAVDDGWLAGDDERAERADGPIVAEAAEQAEDADVVEVVDAVVVGESGPADDVRKDEAIGWKSSAWVAPRRKPLTDLERAVLEVMADGMTVVQASRELGIKPRTARARVERALARNGFHSATALISWAADNGLLLGRRGDTAERKPGGQD
jgi:DNA-binding CsgD family transcriptional regulator